MSAAEKVFSLIQLDPNGDVKPLLVELSHEDVKNSLEQVVHVVVWTKEANLRDGVSCLHYAAKKGRYAQLKEMIRQ